MKKEAYGIILFGDMKIEGVLKDWEYMKDKTNAWVQYEDGNEYIVDSKNLLISLKPMENEKA